MHNIIFSPYKRTHRQALERIASSARVLVPLPSSQERFGVCDVSREFRRYVQRRKEGRFTIKEYNQLWGEMPIGFVAFYMRCGDLRGYDIPPNEERIDYAFLGSGYKDVEAMRKQLQEELRRFAEEHDPRFWI